MVVKAKNPSNEINHFIKGAQQMLDTPLNEEVSRSFMTYSMSVVHARALVDAYDGLKPVQRRILYTMKKEGFLPSKNYVKSARTVGSCMAVYHPHGDSSIYEAMVKLAQPWYVNVPLVDGYGNWGDSGGSGAAASRYTEAKLTKEAMLLLEELDESTVDMRPNYDGEQEEPVVLPAQFPVLLINGAFGIAVGFSSQMAPHNPGEVLDAARWLLTHPGADLEKLMSFVPGPDFPTGGQVIGMDQVKESYESGRGTIRIRAKAEIEPVGRGKHQIIFTEMPYQTKTESILDRIKKLLKEGKLQGLADAQDLTDRRNGTRFVVETKTGVNPEALLLELYKTTPLEDSFGINNVALVNGEPKTLGLKEMLELFLEHRVDVVTRRSQHRKDKRTARLHLVEGLLKALANIDEVIRIVRAAESANVAQERLIGKFKIDDVQADYILSLQLRRLTKFDQIELNEEKIRLQSEIAELDKILNDDGVLKALIGKELEQVKKVLDRPRRTELVGGALADHLEAAKTAAVATAAEVEDAPAYITVYSDGSLKRIEQGDSNPRTALKAAKVGSKVLPLVNRITSSNRGKSILISNLGKGYRVDNLHLSDKISSGSSLVALAKGEKIIAVAPGTGDLGVGTFFATEKGIVKITAPDYPLRSDEFELISLAAGDRIVNASWLPKLEGHITLISSDASLLQFEVTKVRPQGRSGAGVAGINLATDAKVLAAAAVSPEDAAEANVYTFTGSSHKLTPLKVHPVKGRATGGSRSHMFRKGEENLTYASVGVFSTIVGADNKTIALPPVNEKRDGSGLATIESPAFAGD